MSRVYLSGPITGTLNYRRVFQGAKDVLTEKGYSVINPAKLTDVVGDSFSYDEIMAIDLSILNRCDCLVQLPGWENSRGANIEYGFALGTDMIILSLEDLLNERRIERSGDGSAEGTGSAG